jgi:hypothetical protein
MSSQLERYGERTARGIAGGKRVCWALAIRERRARNSKSITFNWAMIKDIVIAMGNNSREGGKVGREI